MYWKNLGKEQDDDTANQVLKEGAAVYLKRRKSVIFQDPGGEKTD